MTKPKHDPTIPIPHSDHDNHANDKRREQGARCRRAGGRRVASLFGGARGRAERRRHDVRCRPFRNADAAIQA